ncbi:hypothetical protein, partial [Streptomyces eurythermus]
MHRLPQGVRQFLGMEQGGGSVGRFGQAEAGGRGQPALATGTSTVKDRKVTAGAANPCAATAP